MAKYKLTEGQFELLKEYIKRTNKVVSENNKLKGGKADKLTISDIAKKFNVPLSKIEKELKMGIDIEIEHTTSRELAKEIAMDHLSEMPDYYTELKKMEKNK